MRGASNHRTGANRQDKGQETRIFRTRSNTPQYFNMLQELSKDKSRAGRELASNASPRGYWSGSDDTLDVIASSGVFPKAVKAFEQAAGNMETHLARATPVLSPVGSSFSIGRIKMGHPKACLYRPKAKLPPKDIALTMNVWTGVTAEQISASMARIAKAAWQYIAAGGIVNLTVNYLHKFSEPQEWQGQLHYGLMDTIKINPTTAASYASAASGQLYRAVSIPLAQALSGQPGDGLPLCSWANPKAFPINGTQALDAAVIAELRIEA